MNANKHLLHPRPDGAYLHQVRPQDYAWRFLEFAVIQLDPSMSFDITTDQKEWHWYR